MILFKWILETYGVMVVDSQVGTQIRLIDRQIVGQRKTDRQISREVCKETDE
jgi:hypothetical protein